MIESIIMFCFILIKIFKKIKIIYSNASPMYAAANVEKIKA
jgi:hypothetical protein